MRTLRIVVAVLIVCSLVILAVQNSSPLIALNVLGVSSVALPVGVWFTGAIALGSLTAIAIAVLTDIGIAASSRASRRRWTVRPDPADTATSRNSRSSRSQDGRPPEPSPRRESVFQTPPRPTPPKETPTPKSSPPRSTVNSPSSSEPKPEPPLQTSFKGQKSAPSTPKGSAAADEDWQAWEQRPSPSQWDDWSQASGNDSVDENLSRRQRKERQRAESTVQDLEKGWDETARDTVYVAPGGSDVQDTLDEIADGWDDWDLEDESPADTAYARRYEGRDREARRDSIYGPPDDAGNRGGDESVYDADYRVIIPPSRSLDDDEKEGDRAP